MSELASQTEEKTGDLLQAMISLGLELDAAFTGAQNLCRAEREEFTRTANGQYCAKLHDVLREITPAIPLLGGSGRFNYQPATSPRAWVASHISNNRLFERRNINKIGISLALLENGMPVYSLVHFPWDRTTYVTHAGSAFLFVNEPGKPDGEFEENPLLANNRPPSNNGFRIAGDPSTHYCAMNFSKYAFVPEPNMFGLCQLASGAVDMAIIEDMRATEIAAMLAILKNAGVMTIGSNNAPLITIQKLVGSDSFAAAHPDTLEAMGFQVPKYLRAAPAPSREIA